MWVCLEMKDPNSQHMLNTISGPQLGCFREVQSPFPHLYEPISSQIDSLGLNHLEDDNIPPHKVQKSTLRSRHEF